jgi:hypothetical protein
MAFGAQAPDMSGLPSAFFGAGPAGGHARALLALQPMLAPMPVHSVVPAQGRRSANPSKSGTQYFFYSSGYPSRSTSDCPCGEATAQMHAFKQLWVVYNLAVKSVKPAGIECVSFSPRGIPKPAQARSSIDSAARRRI